MLTEAPEAPVFALESVDYTVEQQRGYVLEQLAKRGRVAFVELARHWNKGFIIATFLAILEMAQRGLVRLSPTASADDFYVERAPAVDQPEKTNGAIKH